MPPWLALLLGLTVAGALALAFPFRSLEEKIAADLRADPLQIAYLQAWLRVRGDRPQLRYLLARQLADAGRYGAALRELTVLEDSADPALRGRVLLLEVDIALRELRDMDRADERAARLRALHARLAELTRAALPPETEAQLAERAIEAGAGEAALAWFERLLERSAALPAAGWQRAAEQAAALDQPRLAARLYLQAMHAVGDRVARRLHFVAAMRTLQGANRLAEALALAEEHLGPLATDTVTLEFLTRLALAANRPDLAQQYAQMMLKLSLLTQAIALAQAQGRAVPPGWLALADAAPVQALRVQATAADLARTPQLPFDDNLYRLAFEVFLANSNLRDALAVARSAVRQAPARLDWRQRLAQVADWSGQPELALEQWHAIARRTGRAQAWDEVRRRAPALFDAQRWLEALLFAHERAPQDLELVRTIVAAWEARGEPARAIAFLRPADAGRPHLRERLQLAAEVAARAGLDTQQRDLLAALDRLAGPDPARAVERANLLLAAGELEAAYAVLAAAAGPPAPPAAGHRDFWDAYAELARLTGRDDAALRGYRVLIDSQAADEGDYGNAIALLEERDAPAAAALAEAAFARFGRPHHLLQAMALRMRAGDAAAVRALLARLSPAQRQQLARNPNFLAQRASFLLGQRDAAGAAADARQALALQPDDPALRSLLLWSLVAARSAGELRQRLAQWDAAGDPDVADENALAPAYAAGWLVLQEPQRALRWLRHAARGDDPLWLQAWADALDQLGHVDAAWQARRRAWLQLRHASAPAAAARTADFRVRLLGLATQFADGETARALLAQAAAAGDGTPAAAAPLNEAALGYWSARGQPELVQAWLLARYADQLQRPAWAELSVALAADDRARLAELLDTQADWLPLADRAEAARRAGRRGEAATVAWDGLQQRPDHDELQRQLNALLLADAPNAGLAALRFRQRPLAETLWRIDGRAQLTPRLALGLEQSAADRRSTDAAQFVAPAATDLTRALSLHAVGRDGDDAASLTLHQREGLDDVAGALLQASWRPAARLQLGARAGTAQPATDNVFLRAGGVRDLLAAAAALRLSQRDYFGLALEASRYESHAGEALGRGRVARLELRHDLRAEYPDLSVRLTAARLDFRAQTGAADSLLPLLPAAAQPSANAATFMPGATTQFGLVLAGGQSAVAERFNPATRRGWRPHGLLAVTRDSAAGTSVEAQLGLGGSLLGADHLSLGVGGGSGLGLQRTPFLQWGLRYRMAF